MSESLLDCPYCFAVVEPEWRWCPVCRCRLPESKAYVLEQQIVKCKSLIEKLNERFSMGEVSEKAYLDLKGEYQQKIRDLERGMEAAKLEDEKARARNAIGDGAPMNQT